MTDEGERDGPEDPKELLRHYLVDSKGTTGKALEAGLLALNLAFVAVFVAETYSLGTRATSLLWSLEVGLTTIFLVEYLARLYAARDRLAFLTDLYAVADLASILPTILLILLPGLGVAASIDVLRVLRVARVLRFLRFLSGPRFFFGSTTEHFLRVLRLLFTILAIFFVSSGLFYHVENAANPGVSNFGDAFYFTVVTLATVGFGDITPATAAGRWTTVSMILAGLVLIPWQVSKIVQEWMHKEKVDYTCPNCGLRYHDPDASHCKACGEVIYQEYDSREEAYLR